MTAPTFTRATRSQVKARIALVGPSGSGKTWTALTLAEELRNGGGIALIDTEHGRASLYADAFAFDTLSLVPPFSPQRYVEALRAAESAGYAVVVIDSLSHAWFAEGGVLDIVDKAAQASRSGNTFQAWAKGTPEQNRLIEGVLGSRLHVIATMRSKTEYVLEANAQGKQQPRKVGMAPVQRDGVDYEFDVVGEMDLSHTLTITKSRFAPLQDQSYSKPDGSLGRLILLELETGASEEAANGLLKNVGAERQEAAAMSSVKAGSEPVTTSAPTNPSPPKPAAPAIGGDEREAEGERETSGELADAVAPVKSEPGLVPSPSASLDLGPVPDQTKCVHEWVAAPREGWRMCSLCRKAEKRAS